MPTQSTDLGGAAFCVYQVRLIDAPHVHQLAGTAHLWLDRAITVVWLMLLSLFVALFANGYWVA